MGRGPGRDAESDYGDAPPRNSKLGAFFGSLHTLFAVLTMTAGVALNATGAWAIANQSDAGYSSLNCSGSVLAANVYIGIISVCTGAGLIVLAIMGMLAVGQGCCSLFSAIIYVLAMNVLVAAMTFSATVLLTISERGIDYADTRSFFNDVWTTTVSSAPLSACDVEREFQCRGFFDDQCAGCDSTAIADGSCTGGQLRVCPNCTLRPKAGDITSRGWYDRVYPRLRTVVRPVGTTAAVAAKVSGLGLVLFTFARCCA